MLNRYERQALGVSCGVLTWTALTGCVVYAACLAPNLILGAIGLLIWTVLSLRFLGR